MKVYVETAYSVRLGTTVEIPEWFNEEDVKNYHIKWGEFNITNGDGLKFTYVLSDIDTSNIDVSKPDMVTIYRCNEDGTPNYENRLVED